jgi:hypothetical protein
MGPSANRACFLLSVTGKFKGGGERIQIHIDGNKQWVLDGSSLQTTEQPVAATVGCLDAPKLSNEFVWSQGQPSQNLGPMQDANLCFLTSMTGDFEGGGESIQVAGDGVSWQLGGRSQQLGVAATARCIPARSASFSSWSQGEIPTDMGGLAGRVCFLNAVTGHFEGDGESLSIQPAGDRWQLSGTSLQQAVSGTAECFTPCRGKGC